MIPVMELSAPLNTLPANAFRSLPFAEGEHPFEQDTPARGAWYVESGAVALRRTLPGGTEIDMGRFGPGDILGEAFLLLPDYTATCVALEQSQLTRIRRDLTGLWIEENPAFAQAMMTFLAERLEAHHRELALMTIRSAEERVMAALAEHGQNGTVIEFARRIGLTHEATYRALTALTKAGRVTKTGRGRYAIKTA